MTSAVEGVSTWPVQWDWCSCDDVELLDGLEDPEPWERGGVPPDFMGLGMPPLFPPGPTPWRRAIDKFGISFWGSAGAAWTQPGAMTAALNYYRAMPMTPPHKDGTQAAAPEIDPARLTVRVPTLVIWGMKDRHLLPQNLHGLEDYVPDLRVHRIADGSHWVVHECPDEVNQTIRSFLAGEI